jgi:hypothetical protein
VSQDEEMRFSDEELTRFRQEFVLHRGQMDVFRDEQDRRWTQIGDHLERIERAQDRNTQNLGILIDETRGIIQFNKDIQGAARIGKGFQSFLTYLVKLGAAGGAIATEIYFILDHFGKGGPPAS